MVSIRLTSHTAAAVWGPGFILLGGSEFRLRKSPLPLRFYAPAGAAAPWAAGVSKKFRRLT